MQALCLKKVSTFLFEKHAEIYTDNKKNTSLSVLIKIY